MFSSEITNCIEEFSLILRFFSIFSLIGIIYIKSMIYKNEDILSFSIILIIPCKKGLFFRYYINLKINLL